MSDSWVDAPNHSRVPVSFKMKPCPRDHSERQASTSVPWPPASVFGSDPSWLFSLPGLAAYYLHTPGPSVSPSPAQRCYLCISAVSGEELFFKLSALPLSPSPTSQGSSELELMVCLCVHVGGKQWVSVMCLLGSTCWVNMGILTDHLHPPSL